MKYNLALIPASKSDEAISLAKKFSDIADEYLLGDKSFPHVTLYQFQAEEKEIEHIWEQVCGIWEEQLLFLTFNKFSCMTFDDNIFWISLLPDNRDVLLEMHGYIANILGLPIKKTFDPHMTLISTKNKEYEKEAVLVSDSYKPITDKFMLALGVLDNIGQVTNIIYRFDGVCKNFCVTSHSIIQ
jgi:2'-5' RNA ligase